MKKILFPTAYTTHSKVAFRFAQRLALYFGAEITLVHIYESPNLALAGKAGMYQELKNQGLQNFANEQWDRELAKLKSFSEELTTDEFQDIPLDYMVMDGDVVYEILQIREQNSFDLVVMGMRRHNLGGRLFGNTTYSLIDKINCDLFLVPPEAHYMGLDKIIFGTAFEFSEQRAINQLLGWCKAFSAKLHLLHVYQAGESKVATSKMSDVVEVFEDELEDGLITVQLMEGEIVHAIESYLEATAADVLAIHRRKKGFWKEILDGSITKILTEELHIPLLILKS